MFCAGPDGEPMTQEPDPLSPEQVAATERAWRGSQLDATDALVQRHRDEREDGANTTLSAGQYQELQAYRRSLREWPETEGFPSTDICVRWGRLGCPSANQASASTLLIDRLGGLFFRPFGRQQCDPIKGISAWNPHLPASAAAR